MTIKSAELYWNNCHDILWTESLLSMAHNNFGDPLTFFLEPHCQVYI